MHKAGTFAKKYSKLCNITKKHHNMNWTLFLGDDNFNVPNISCASPSLFFVQKCYTFRRDPRMNLFKILLCVRRNKDNRLFHLFFNAMIEFPASQKWPILSLLTSRLVCSSGCFLAFFLFF